MLVLINKKDIREFTQKKEQVPNQNLGCPHDRGKIRIFWSASKLVESKVIPS